MLTPWSTWQRPAPALSPTVCAALPVCLPSPSAARPDVSRAALARIFPQRRRPRRRVGSAPAAPGRAPGGLGCQPCLCLLPQEWHVSQHPAWPLVLTIAESEKQLARRKEELAHVILHVLRRHPALCYFQGYHDIVQVFLLVLGAHDAPAAVARLSLLRIRDFMLSSLDPAISQLELLRPILRAADPALYDRLPKSQPSFALAGTITMFAHNIQDYRDITRLFDFFLARHAVMPIYLFAAVVLSKREELLEIDKEDEDVMYVMLSRLPQPFDVEFHLARTVELYERLPPASLNSWEWWRISSSSVLKASATNASLRRLTLEDGETFLAQQEKELRRQHALKRAAKNVKYVRMRLWYYRRYSVAGLAVLVGAYALWLGRNGGLSSPRHPFLTPLGDLFKRFIGIPS